MSIFKATQRNLLFHTKNHLYHKSCSRINVNSTFTNPLIYAQKSLNHHPPPPPPPPHHDHPHPPPPHHHHAHHHPPPPPPPPHHHHPRHHYRRRKPFFRRLRNKLLGLGVALGVFYYFMDADFITYFMNIYRKQYDIDGMNDKTIWIIGASSGIGEYLVYQLIESGAKRIIISSRRQNDLERVRNNCKQKIKNINHKININDNKNENKNKNKRLLDCEIIIKPLDVLDFVNDPSLTDKYVNNLFESINEFSDESDYGGINVETQDIDILIINSGRTQKSLAINNSKELLLGLQNLNVFGPVLIAQSMCKYWNQNINNGKVSKKNKKFHQVAFTSSLAGKMGAPTMAAYSMTKYGLNGYMEAMRAELFNDKIDINIICPGIIELTDNSYPSFGSKLDKVRSRQTARNKYGAMTLSRCAELYTTALQYSLTESWIGNSPLLLFAYLRQYVPVMLKPFGQLFGKRYVDGENELADA